MLRLIELDFFSQFLFAYLDLCYLYQIQTRDVICDFQQCGILTSVDSDEPSSLLLSLETPNNVQSVD